MSIKNQNYVDKIKKLITSLRCNNKTNNLNTASDNNLLKNRYVVEQ